MTAKNTDLLIGQMLIEAQVLRARDLSEAIKIAKLTGLPIGRILIMSSFVAEREFQAAVQAQSLVRDAVIPLQSAIRALSVMSRTDLEFTDALSEVGCAPAPDASTNKLGELLIAASIINQQQLDRGLATSLATYLPLGRVLVSMGAISEETLTTVLNVQILIRDGKISREQGINGMKGAHDRRVPLELALAEKGFYRGPFKPSIRLGELLVTSGIISTENMMSALETGLVKKLLLGEVLVSMQVLTETELDMALTLQEMVANRTLDPELAAQCLKEANLSLESLESILSQLEVSKEQFRVTVRLHDLLRVAGLLQHSDIELCDLPKATAPSSKDAIETAGALMRSGFIDQRTYYGALRCYYLIAIGWMNLQQGIIALNYFSHEKESNFDEILHKLDWTLRTRPPEPIQNSSKSKN